MGTTVGAAFHSVEADLADAGVESAEVVAGWILSAVVGLPALELLMRREQTLLPAQVEQVTGLVRRVCGGEPVQYVVGETAFMGLPFRVDRRALIPRPETELLVDLVLGHAPLWARKEPAVADVGTGTGCIVLSLAHARPDARYMGIDQSADALDLARENAAKLGLQDAVTWRQANLLDGIAPGSLDAVVSNPPYLTAAEYAAAPAVVREFEPALALLAGDDGLELIRPLARQAMRALAPGGLFVLEVGTPTARAALEVVRKSGFDHVELRRDLCDKDRVVMGTKS